MTPGLDRRRTWAAWRLSCCTSLCLCLASHAVAAGEAEGWQALYAAVPALPATPIEAAKQISVRPVHTEGLGMTQLRVEVADPRLRGLQRQVDQLFEPTAKASAAQIQRGLDAVNNDPVLTELARKIDKVWQPDPNNPNRVPSPDEIRTLNREVKRVLGPMASPADAALAPRSEIAAYRLELQRASPRASQFLQRLAAQQRQYAQQHMQADKQAMTRLAGTDVAATARALVARHHELARQQLADASAILHEAREALAPRVERLVELARAAEQRNAAPGERNEAYALLKAYVELLLTLQREVLQDVGFWGGMRVATAGPAPAQAGMSSLYEQALAPGFELRANGELPYSLPHYPLGRAIVVGLPPGIR